MRQRKIKPPYHIREGFHYKAPEKKHQRLCMKRFFALHDPQLEFVRATCVGLFGKRGWVLRPEKSGKNTSPRMMLYIQKAFPTHEAAVNAGNAFLAMLGERQRPASHKLAKQWLILGPEGQTHTVKNLLHFCRANPELFKPYDSPGALVQSGLQLADRVYAGLRDPRQRFWKGWKATKMSAT